MGLPVFNGGRAVSHGERAGLYSCDSSKKVPGSAIHQPLPSVVVSDPQSPSSSESSVSLSNEKSVDGDSSLTAGIALVS